MYPRKDSDKKDKPDRKKKAPRQQATKPTGEDEGWTTVSGTDKVAKVSEHCVFILCVYTVCLYCVFIMHHIYNIAKLVGMK